MIGMTSVGAQASPTTTGPTTTGSATVTNTATLTPDVARTVRGVGAEAVQQALTAYWTPDRMKAAKPDADLPSMKAAAATRQAVTGAATVPQGAQQRIAGISPKAEPTAVQPGASDSSGVSTQATAPNYPVGHPTARTNGKVFFTSFGQNFVCSGAVVNTEGKSSVWTAGHCVSDGGAFNTNWVFVPNYASGSAPFGTWTAASLTTTGAWHSNNNDFANDVGSAIMNRTFGQRIADYLGAQGITWNAAVAGNFVWAFGYPQAPPFNGCCLFTEANSTSDGGGGTIFMANAMTGGSSGGPWLAAFDGNFGLINGHNDFKFNNSPQLMFSPYYGNQVAAVYNAVRFTST